MKYDSVIKPPKSRALKSGRVILEPGEEIGEHVTEAREELIVVLKGRATLIKERETIEIEQGNTHFINEGIKHNVKNNSDQVLEYIYVVSLFDGKTQ
jgi:quercetin dioxygenase-like cupin family protein